jgi:hypothetical protein
MEMLPAIGKSTGINSTKTDRVRKKANITHILGIKNRAGNKYVNRAIAKIATTATYIFSFTGKLLPPINNKN